MAGNEEITAKIKLALDVAGQCSAAATSEKYEILNDQLQELESLARQFVQSHADYRSLLGKLQKGSPLTADELKTLRLLIVGDADYYLKYDDEFDRWKGELGRIVGEIRRLQSGKLDVDGLMHLRVLCREACSLLNPTGYYLEQKERVGRFEEATRGPIDRDAGRVLADMIKNMAA